MGRAPRPEGAIAFAPMIHSTTEGTENTDAAHSWSFVFIPASIRVEKAFTTEVRKLVAGKCSYPPCSYRPLQVPSFRFQVPRLHVPPSGGPSEGAMAFAPTFQSRPTARGKIAAEPKGQRSEALQL